MLRREYLSPRFLLLPSFLLGAGLALTWVLQDAAREATRQSLSEEFGLHSQEIIENIHQHLDRYEQILEGTTGLFAASREVTPEEFSHYVRKLKFENKFPSIQGIGFSRWLAAPKKNTHIAQMRAYGLTGYNIYPPGQRDFYSSIVSLEPSTWRNQRAIGYDMFSDPVRRVAMEHARDEGKGQISGQVQLLQETENDVQTGFVMFVPVYQPLSVYSTLEERRTHLIGWAYAPFGMNDLMTGILGERFGKVTDAMHLEIYDGSTVQAERRIFTSVNNPNHSTGAFDLRRQVNLFGHTWTISLHTLPPFDARINSDKANTIAIAGSLGSLLLALVAWLLVSAYAHARSLTENMTRELQRSEAAQRKLNRALRLLSACNMALVHATDEHSLLAEICRLCIERGGYLLAWVGYAEHDVHRTVRPATQHGFEADYLDRIHLSWGNNDQGQGPTGTAIRTGKTSINQDVLTNPAMSLWRDAAIERGYQASVALPLICDTQVLGALSIYAADANAFDVEEVHLLEELATDLAFGIMTLRARTEHAAAKEQLEFLAHFDPLTHLPNRLLLRDRFEYAAPVARSAQTGMALLYLDLDQFKQINDSLGYAVGDQVLVEVMLRVQQCLSATDTISRLNGDEFVILCSSTDDATTVATIANAIRDILTDPIQVAGNSLSVSCSIGIGLFPEDGEDFDTLLNHAHTAVNSAKEAGRRTYRFFTREMNAGLRDQMRLTGALTEAVRQQQFLLHYQPQIDIETGNIVGVEALVRWQHPTDGMVPPGKFIPLAERSGHIVQIGEWVLHEACRQGRWWQDQGLTVPLIAVNFSAVQFKRGNVLELVSAALAVSGLPANRLELELTESILLQDVNETIKTLQSLKELGVKLSIDDFGTGYSSLAYLKQLSVNKLKIDQSFVRDMLTDNDGASIVKAIIQLGHTLQLEVIAEGVETAAHLAFLHDAGCDQAQGYLLSRPVPAEQCTRLLQEGLANLLNQVRG